MTPTQVILLSGFNDFVRLSRTRQILATNRAPDDTVGAPDPKKFWMPWKMTQKQISRKTSLGKYDLRKTLLQYGYQLQQNQK